MAQNTLEIWIKANASKAQATLRAFDKELNKFGIDTGKGFSLLKAKWSEFDAMLSTPKGFKTLLGTAASVAGSLAGVGLAIKKLSDDYMDYAFQVKDFGRIIGATPEEASKLIQVADDVRLSVGSMTTALRSAITKGYAPSIEGLGQLADEYLAIQDPIERSRFLVETFGRSGLEMAKLLELGSQKIQEMGDSIEGTGRLMTEEGIAKAQAYYEALDQLGDAAESAKLSLGGELLPAVTGVATETAKLAESGGDLIGMFMRMQNAVDDNIISGEQFLGLLAGYTIGTRDYADVIQYLNDKTAIAREKQDALTNAIQSGFFAYEQSTPAVDEYGNALGNAANEAADLRTSLQKTQDLMAKEIEVKIGFRLPDITSQLAAWVKSDKWRALGGVKVEGLFAEIQPKLLGLSDADRRALAGQISALELAVKVELGEIPKNEAQSQLQKAFGMTGAEAKVTLDAAIEVDTTSIDSIDDFLTEEQFGINVFPELDEGEFKTVTDTMTTPVETAILPRLNQGMLAEQLRKIPSSKTLTVNIKVKGLEQLEDIGVSASTNTGQNTSGRAVGGPVFPYQSYIVGERGPELFIPNMAGRIVNNAQTSQITNQPTTITNTFILPQQTNVRELARLVYKEQQRAGVT